MKLTKNAPAKIVLSLILSLLLSGCGSLFGVDGFFRDRGDDYLRSEPLEPLQLPAGIEAHNVQALYGIPPISNDDFDSTAEFEVPRPLSLSANLLEETVKIQKLGARRWILINVPPSEVWPQLRSFLAQNNLDLSRIDTTNGILETYWVQFKDDLSKKDKFRLQIDQGVQPETSEIHILQVSVDNSQSASGEVNWPISSMNPEREAVLLDDLAATLASDMSASISMLAQNIGGKSKINMAQVDGEPVLQMKLEYKRAWATIGYSVNREGFSLFDDDRKLGIYYVSYIKPVEKSDSWFSWGSDEVEIPSSPYDITQLLAHLQLSDAELESDQVIFPNVARQKTEALTDVPGYLVVLRGEGNRIQVRIRDGYGRILSPKEARQLLKTLRRNLI